MSSVAEFVHGKTFEEVKSTLGDISLDVKEDGDLYMISFNKNSDFTGKFMREANGIIFEKETNKLVHHCFDKAYDGVWDNNFFKNCILDGDTYNCENFEDLDYAVEHYTEGSLIRVYWYNGVWNVGSSRKINATFSHWGGETSLKELFYEAMKVENIDLNTLDKNYCYSYIMQHPKLKICMDVSAIFCMMINKVNLQTFEETRNTENFKIDKKISELVLNADRIDKNYIVYLADGTRIKMISEQYKYAQSLLGNHPSIKWSYLEAIQNGKDHQLKAHHRSSNDVFEMIDKRIHDTVCMIHLAYMTKHVKKEETQVYHKHERSLTQLHAIYRKHREPITYDKVMELVVGLKLKTLHWILNL